MLNILGGGGGGILLYQLYQNPSWLPHGKNATKIGQDKFHSLVGIKPHRNGPMMTSAELSILQALSYPKQIVILIPVKRYTASLFGLSKMMTSGFKPFTYRIVS